MSAAGASTARPGAPWGAAGTLEERVARYQGSPLAAPEGDQVGQVADVLAYWRDSCGDDRRLAMRLGAAGLDSSGLGALLVAASNDAGGIDEVPVWAEHLRRRYEESGSGRAASEDDAARAVVAPAVAWVAESLLAQVAEGGSEPTAASMAQALLPGVEKELADLVLPAATQAWQDDPAVAPWAFLLRRPALARLLHTRTIYAIESGSELIRRWGADRGVLEALPWSPAPGSTVVSLSAEGDSHARGRRTVLLHFSCGTRLLYKPRPHEAEAQLGALLRRLSAAGMSDSLHLPQMLTGDRYAWVQYVSARSCRSEAEVRRYYRRLGAWIAVLHALGGVDIHFENLIACGDVPLLIDLECLFTGVSPEALDQLRPEATSSSATPVPTSVPRAGATTSVLTQLVLRRYQAVLTPADISGIGSGLHRRIDDPAESLAARPNLVHLGGRPVTPAQYVDSITSGFAEVHALLTDLRDELQRPDGAVGAFAGCEVRYVARPTVVYVRLLLAALHPAVVGDALERDAVLAGLWRGLTARPELESIVLAELDDLRRGDVPRFGVLVGAPELVDSAGTPHEQRGVSQVLDPATCLDRLTTTDRMRQLAVIRSAVELMPPTAWPRHRLPSTSNGDARPAVRGAVEALANRIAVLTHDSEDGVRWPGVTYQHGRFVVRLEDPTLGSGGSGIALFLAAAAERLGWERGGDLARRSCDEDVADLDRTRSNLEQRDVRAVAPQRFGHLGYAQGVGGRTWALLRLARWSGDTRLAAAATDGLLRSLDSAPEGSTEIDVATGAAGTLPALLELERAGEPVRQRLGALADRLAAALATPAAERRSAAEADVAAARARRDLDAEPADARAGSGFGRGGAGVSALLLAAGVRLERADLADAAVGLLQRAAEQAPERSPSGALGGSLAPGTSWGEGLVGTGLALAAAIRLAPTRTASLAPALLRIARSADPEALGHDHSLASGDLGVVELLLAAGDVLDERSLRDSARRVTRAVIEDIAEHQPRCGHPGGTEGPGLLFGLAGIGYGLLAAEGADPLPSVLTPGL